ncbi:MAG: type 1 glutamine amidotransferase [Dongiaceae bacterium]
MRILAIQNYPSTPVGAVGEVLEQSGARVDVAHVYDRDPVPTDPDDYHGLVVLGGAQSAAEADNDPMLNSVMDLIRKFHAADRPVMGICLGHQLVVRAFDGPVHRLSGFEFGFSPLATAKAGENDPLVAGLATPHRMMQWHEDSTGLPDGAVHILAGETTPIQGFRLGRATYGFQGHFEATPAILETWIKGSTSPQRHFGERAGIEFERVRREIGEHAVAARAFAENVTRRWLGLVRG